MRTSIGRNRKLKQLKLLGKNTHTHTVKQVKCNTFGSSGECSLLWQILKHYSFCQIWGSTDEFSPLLRSYRPHPTFFNKLKVNRQVYLNTWHFLPNAGFLYQTICFKVHPPSLDCFGQGCVQATHILRLSTL